MNHLYLDCQYGISGDMTLSALINLGADLDYIKEHLRKLPIDPFTMETSPVDKHGIHATELILRFPEEKHHHPTHPDAHNHDHIHEHHHNHRHASSIFRMIEESMLPQRVKVRSTAIFKVIAEAEAKIHGMDPDDVHFHEVGAMDSILDIIGVCLALESLAIESISAAPVPTGYGKIQIAHGLYPVPAPATAEILIGIPLADFQAEGELTTPTGAAFLKALVEDFGHLPSLPIDKISYGAGKKDFDHPNVLRAVLFQTKENPSTERITVLECQLDDMEGETLGYVMEKALSMGALDIYYTPITMKKSRPGTLITLLAKTEDSVTFEDLLLRETSTFGVRRMECDRSILSRRMDQVETVYGLVSVKIGFKGEHIYKVTPEFEDAKEIALKNDIPLRKVYSEVNHSARQLIKAESLL
ncbi:nickel pincer cofactor biosynthesis protein LarC [Halobacillus litoralis]|uniref:Pyridinium-3,5-bisthiocarboxylic acid mononucleotide nickel insertion protein n=1 Tax=Halobacillus litoralis TaxID=45668 RepID=A0A410MFQ3_9BACI|nr:nickel pincer cofactor biosynthesis protein LarC [Halobacillus litoralis]QAS53533.1 TIGR00299 family protein [Halobacillus litoralis]